MSNITHKSDSSWCEIHKRKKRIPERGLSPDVRVSLVCNVCDFLARKAAEVAD